MSNGGKEFKKELTPIFSRKLSKREKIRLQELKEKRINDRKDILFRIKEERGLTVEFFKTKYSNLIENFFEDNLSFNICQVGGNINMKNVFACEFGCSRKCLQHQKLFIACRTLRCTYIDRCIHLSEKKMNIFCKKMGFDKLRTSSLKKYKNVFIYYKILKILKGDVRDSFLKKLVSLEMKKKGN